MTFKRYDLVEIDLTAVEITPVNPFIEVTVSALFRSPNGTEIRLAGFFDGGQTWKVRFTPGETGRWTFQTTSSPADPGLNRHGSFEIEEATLCPGFLRARRGIGWGLQFDSGEPLLLAGDTQYNLFGAAHSGLDIEAMLCRRWDQGFNTIRARLAVSPFHPNTPFSDWMSSDCWLWGGSPQIPDLTRFNLGYLNSVDVVFRLAAELGLGIELILEAWLMEFPFNDRRAFLPEHEELMIAYAMARFSAFTSLAIVNPANEYNLHLEDRNSPLNDRFAERLARLIRRHDPFGHPIGIHVTAAERMDPPFQDRFRDIPEVDVLLMQTWGDLGGQAGISLCRHLEDNLLHSAIGSGKVNILAEYGYEGMPLSSVGIVSDAVIDESHSRRGALKAVFMGLHVMHGFGTTWAPIYTTVEEPPGAAWFPLLKRLMNEILDFSSLRPRPDLIRRKTSPAFLLADETLASLAVYLPEGGECSLVLPKAGKWTLQQLDPSNLRIRKRPGVEGKRVNLTGAATSNGKSGRKLPSDSLFILRRSQPSKVER